MKYLLPFTADTGFNQDIIYCSNDMSVGLKKKQNKEKQQKPTFIWTFLNFKQETKGVFPTSATRGSYSSTVEFLMFRIYKIIDFN